MSIPSLPPDNRNAQQVDDAAGAYIEPDVDQFNHMTPQNHDPGLWGDGLEDGNPTAKTLFIILGALCVLIMVFAVVTLFI